MLTVTERLPDLAELLDYASEDHRRLVEDAYLRTLAHAPRHRPASLHPMIRSHPPERVAAARARTLAAELEVRQALVADSLSTAEVATALGISEPGVRKRRTAGQLVAFVHKGDWRYPTWQLRGGELLSGVVETWRALPDHDRISLVRWFTLPSRDLGDRSPLDALGAGDTSAVVTAASAVGSR
jgi:hypothetical protein